MMFMSFPRRDISTLADVVRVHGASAPDRPMLTYEARTWTFGDMDRRTNQVGQALLSSGVRAGDRVAFLDKNSPEFFELVFGAAKVGAVTVALNWRLAPREIAEIVADAQAKVLVVGAELAAALEKVEHDLPSGLRILAIGDHVRWPQFDHTVAAHRVEDPGFGGQPDDVGLQLYTSGTTGLPKGVMLTNANLVAMMTGVARAWGFHRDMVNLGVMPLFHIGGSGWDISVMAEGGHTILHREVDPPAILRAIEEHRVTHALFVPAVLLLLLGTPGVDRTDFSTLGTIVYGASPISDEVLTRAMDTFGCRFIQSYGLTETAGGVVQLTAAEHDPANPDLLRSCGRPMAGVELRIVDTDTGTDQPEGVVGEVWLRSAQNMLGYWGKPEETAKTKTPDGWIRTGDAGYLEDGYLYLYDRVKDMIVSGAENVYPAEVENVLMGHPDVADVAVIGVPHPKWGETVKAVVVATAGADPDPVALIAYAREHLAHYKCPTSVDLVAALPRNPSGKLLKRELREPYWEGQDRRIGG
jgi:long-chain acyl-CoA synthetase